jgi:hypothetical protein
MLRVMSLAEEEIPQAQFFGFDFELLDDRNHSFPPLGWIGWQLCMSKFNGR